MAQILISAAISSLISLVIINHEIIVEKIEDIADWVSPKLNKQGKDKHGDG